MMDSQLILASRSVSRRGLLSAAGVSFRVCASKVDEDSLKASGRQEGIDASVASMRLAEAKALDVAQTDGIGTGSTGVIGADQILEHGGVWFDKPKDHDEAQAQLRQLRGCRYSLWTSVCLVSPQGGVVWRHTDRSILKMRAFDDAFLAAYMQQAGDDVLLSPGACLLERQGIQLLEHIEGDYFAILGLPMVALLRALREQGWLVS